MKTRSILYTIILFLSTLLIVLLYFIFPSVTMIVAKDIHFDSTQSYATPKKVVEDTYDPYILQQGQSISIVEKSFSDGSMTIGVCSIGYIDDVQRKLYVAAHCAMPNKNGNSPVRKVLFRDIDIGEIYPNENYNEDNMANDWTIVNVTNDDITLGKNRFSGDRIVNPDDIQPGDKVYTYGSTSGLSEGEVFGVRGNQIYVTHAIIDGGDSGGAVWVEGKGFIGVISNKRGYNKEELESATGNYVAVVNAVNSKYDETVEFNDIERMYTKWFYSTGIKNILR